MIATNPQGVNLYFNKDTYKYYTENVDEFKAATTLVNSYFPEFEKYKIAKLKAEKKGVSVNQILMDWQKTSDEAIELGHMAHKFCEEKLLDKEYTILPVTDKQRNIISLADKTIDKLLEKFEFVATEKIIFSEKYKIAGTIDLLMKYKNKIIIFDWKTNNKIETGNNYHKYGFEPFEHLDNNNYTHYQLQLNLYKWMLIKEKYYDCDIDMKLLHLTEDGLKIYSVKDYQDEINDIIL